MTLTVVQVHEDAYDVCCERCGWIPPGMFGVFEHQARAYVESHPDHPRADCDESLADLRARSLFEIADEARSSFPSAS